MELKKNIIVCGQRAMQGGPSLNWMNPYKDLSLGLAQNRYDQHELEFFQKRGQVQ